MMDCKTVHVDLALSRGEELRRGDPNKRALTAPSFAPYQQIASKPMASWHCAAGTSVHDGAYPFVLGKVNVGWGACGAARDRWGAAERSLRRKAHRRGTCSQRLLYPVITRRAEWNLLDPQ